MLAKLAPERALELLLSGTGPEVAGRYLHWDELRRRKAPAGVSVEEWWVAISVARGVLRTELPLTDSGGQPFHFVRTDALHRLLHEVDRALGSPLEVTDPQLANRELRDRYVVHSLMEEAITSSQLEGASTTRHVAKKMLRSGRAPQTQDERMIANNFRAMEFVRQNVETPLSKEFLIELHRILTEGTMDAADVGRFRRPDESIAVQDAGDGRVLHLPPPADTLPRRIEALSRFANDASDDAFIHPVVRAITLHFMLGYEHPFVDGNGRTARALFYWSLLRQKYWLIEFLSISRVIQKAKAQYARAFLFTETDGGDATYFLLHQLGVLREALEDLRVYLEAKAEELRESEKLLRAEVELNYRQRALIAHALRHPGASYTIEGYRRENAVVYETARSDLLALASLGLLKQRRVGKAFAFDVPADLERRLKSTRSPVK